MRNHRREMIIHNRKKKSGRGLVNKIINKLPFEAHIPGYKFCGPGTKLKDRLARGDLPINQLDSACRDHDIAYSQNRENIEARNEADQVLANKAWKRVFAKDADWGEKAAAYSVTNVMNLKTKLGMGLKKRKTSTKKKKSDKKKCNKKMTSLNAIIKASSKSSAPGQSAKSIITTALKTARSAIKKSGGKSKVKVPRILPVPSKIGGVLPLIPLFAGLSAVGTLSGGAAGVYKAITNAKSARQQLEESKRHNKTMEAIALGKGLYLKPYKTGLGLYLGTRKKGGMLYLRPYKTGRSLNLKPGRGLKKKSSKSVYPTDHSLI